MTERRPDARRVEERAEALLPEERIVGSDDPEAQAQAILEESDERTRDWDEPEDERERRRSEDTVEPLD